VGSFSSRQFRAKSGEAITIRAAVPDDAPALLAHARAVIEERDLFITLPEEFDHTVDSERAWIEQHANDPGHLVLVADIAGKIEGMLFFENGPRKRLAHRGVLHMSVSRAWRSRGVGTALLQSLVDWGSEHATIEKLRLAVLATNARAMGLYKKLGFVEEGRRPKEVKLAPGQYVDDILMYRFV
jgi:RimJ/RimL family protein N-acetyltransferase